MGKINLDTGDALVIVAHPDDETIWMGGTILSSKKIIWTIISLCRSSDPDRAPKFKKVGKIYRAKALIFDLEDEGIMTLEQSKPVINKILKSALNNLGKKNFNYIFTHGSQGEYGHFRHRGVNQVLTKLIKEKFVRAAKSFSFAYQKPDNINYCLPKKNADFIFQLQPEVYQRKREIIEKEYGFTGNSFESLSCAKFETFDELKIL